MISLIDFFSVPGNMWAQSWSGISDLVLPFPDVAGPNVTQLLIENGYTPIRMFKVTRQNKTSHDLVIAYFTLYKGS